MQISWAPIHFSPAFSSIAVKDAKCWPKPALPFQLLSGRRGGGRAGSGSEWCCSYSQDGLQEPLSTTGIVCVTKTCPCAWKAWGFYLLTIHLYTLLRTAEKLFKIQLFASGTLKFHFSLPNAAQWTLSGSDRSLAQKCWHSSQGWHQSPPSCPTPGDVSQTAKGRDENLCLSNTNTSSAESESTQEAIKRAKSSLVHTFVAKRLSFITKLKRWKIGYWAV